MRRLYGVLLLIVCAVPAVASAATWHHFTSKSFGFSFQYPSAWTMTTSDIPKQLTVQRAGAQAQSLQVSVLDLKPQSTIAQTLFKVKALELSRGNTAFARANWTSSTIAKRAAMVAVVRPPTEGGVAVSNGIYVTASKSHVYEITLVAYHASKLAQFPSVYKKILATWRFI